MKLSYPEYRLRKNKNQLLFFLAGLFGVIVLSTYYSVVHLNAIRISNITALVIVLTFASMFSILISRISDFIDDKIEKILADIERSKLGVDGEKLAKQVILSSIGAEDRAFFNKNLPTGGDIDCLILGEKGLILIEIKNFSRPIKLPLFWVRGFNDPRNEAKKHAVELKKYLVESGYNKHLKIRKAVLYINKDVTYWGKQEVFNIRGLDSFAPYFFGLPLDNAITDQNITEVSTLIEKLK